MATSLGPHRSLVLGLCFATIVFDGYDLIVYGSTVPALLEYEPWGLTPQRVGTIGSLALAGMLVGALSIGAVTDRIGRRRVLIGCLAFFSLAMAGCAVSPNVEFFAACRFFAGLGIGGVMPTAVALTVEWAPEGRQHRYNALMFSGYSVGGIAAALMAVWFLEEWGFRALFALGAIPLVTVVPLAWRFLPESQRPGSRAVQASPGARAASCHEPCSPATGWRRPFFSLRRASAGCCSCTA